MFNNRYLFPDQLFNVLQFGSLLLITKSNGDAGIACPARSANPVNVRFGYVWKIKVEDMR